VQGLTEFLYEAREKALERLQIQAQKYNADEVVGVKTRVYNLGGGLVEFMVIGTAVKKIEGAKTANEHLIPQAIIQDRDTFVDGTQDEKTTSLNESKAASARALQMGPVHIIIFFIVFIFYILKAFLAHH